MKFSHQLRFRQRPNCAHRKSLRPWTLDCRLWPWTLGGLLIRRDFRRVQICVAGGTIPFDIAAHVAVVFRVKLPPVNATWALELGMPVHIDEVDSQIVLFHLGLPSEILVVERRGLL